MLAKVTLAKVFAAVLGLNMMALVGMVATGVWDHADVWAPVANTMLLIVLAVLAKRNSNKIDLTHESVHDTARTAASAAEAAAEAARVAKAIGSTIRVDVPPTIDPPQEP